MTSLKRESEGDVCRAGHCPPGTIIGAELAFALSLTLSVPLFGPIP